MDRRALIAALACVFTGCISAVEAPMQRDAITPERPIVLIVFPSPAPLMDESNSNIEQAAKVIPGLSIIYGAGQGRRDLEASHELGRVLPAWQPAPLFESAFRAEISNGALPGRLLAAAEAGVADVDLVRMNAAEDIIDWQRRYFIPQPDNSGLPPPRAYSMMPGLRESVILEVNLAYGAPSDGKGQWTPVVSLVARLVRGSDNSILWRHEDRAEDKAGTKPSQAYLNQPAELITRYQSLIPTLAKMLVASLQKGIHEASAPANPFAPAFPAAPTAPATPATPATPSIPPH